MKRIITLIALAAIAHVGYGECQGPNCPFKEKGEGTAKQSWDPNEMAGPLGTGEKRYVRQGEWLSYTIYFENKAEADAAAQEVSVDLPMDENLDWTTLELGEIAFGEHTDMSLSGKSHGKSRYAMPGTNTFVDTEVSVITKGGKQCLHWYLRDYDPTTIDNFPAAAEAGFLPPNNPETHCGEGHLSYRVRVKSDAVIGAVARASAQIIFDDNPMIETDPAWWNTVGTFHDIELEVDGVTTNLTLIAGEPFGELPEPTQLRTGYTFDSWYTGENGTGVKAAPTAIVPEEDFVLHQNWTGNPYTVRFDPNGGTGAMTDQSFVYGTAQKLSANAFTWKMYAFVGWALRPDGVAEFSDGQSVENLASMVGEVVTLYAVWKLDQPLLWTNVTGAVSTSAALTYDGYIYKDTIIVGTIQVKVGKSGNDGMASMKATVIGLDGKKKSLKAMDKGKARIDISGPTKIPLVGGEEYCEVTLGTKGMSGKYGSYNIDGTLNVFTSKDAMDKVVATAALGKWQAVNVAWRDGAVAPYHTLSVTIANKGKAKVSGTLADGTKVSASSQLLVGDEWCCVPVLEPKKAKLAFNVWLPLNVQGASSPIMVGIEDAVVDKPGMLKSGAKFHMDDVLGDAKYAKYLPDGLAVAQNGTKWILAGGAKAGKVQLTKDGLVDEAKAGDNASALKLTYTAKTGSFKGSFKAYSDVNGKPKGVTVNVTGVLVDGIGYGAATIKKVGGVPVNISDR